MALEVRSVKRIVGTRADLGDRLVTMDGRAVEDVSKIAIRIVNAGNVSIGRSDYDGDLGFSLAACAGAQLTS